MKQGLNPTRAQKIAITNAGLNAKNWLVLSDEKHAIVIRHKSTGSIRILQKG